MTVEELVFRVPMVRQILRGVQAEKSSFESSINIAIVELKGDAEPSVYGTAQNLILPPSVREVEFWGSTCHA